MSTTHILLVVLLIGDWIAMPHALLNWLVVRLSLRRDSCERERGRSCVHRTADHNDSPHYTMSANAGNT